MLCPFPVLRALALFVASGEMAVTPISSALSQPLLPPTPALHNTSFLRDTPFIFSVPGTPIKLHLSSFHGRLSQGEQNICIIEGLSKIFETVVAKGSDGGLPLHTWSTRWVNVIFGIEDVHPPVFAMTYGYLVSTLRGVTLFASQYGYVEMDIEVYHDTKGYVGIGYLGQIIPSAAS